MYSQAIEDYLEVILGIAQKKGHARTKDISSELGISSPSVTEMLRKLDEKDLVDYKRYGGVTLTTEGEKIAKSVKKRHNTIRKLLRIIQVSDKTAEKDACRIEHELSPETIEQLKRFVDFIDPSKHPKLIEDFRSYCENEAH
ncbi:MAG: metal-dependent transcriptional regulator [Candidatus Altiarchaeota archaeon]|nr:metal-dependent transcriptional regulator [Candidatus Altiarchaeota archaeon]